MLGGAGGRAGRPVVRTRSGKTVTICVLLHYIGAVRVAAEKKVSWGEINGEGIVYLTRMRTRSDYWYTRPPPPMYVAADHVEMPPNPTLARLRACCLPRLSVPRGKRHFSFPKTGVQVAVERRRHFCFNRITRRVCQERLGVGRGCGSYSAPSTREMRRGMFQGAGGELTRLPSHGSLAV